MALPPPVKETLSLLINAFLGPEDLQSRDLLQRKLITILKHHYQTNSDTATKEHFEGLEEKCRVLKHDELADALIERYDKLKEWQNRWKFDILSFLLQLADNPVDKTRLEVLQEFAPPPLPPNITWKDLLKDDPYEDDAIWQDINYAESSSGESAWSVQASDEEIIRVSDSELDVTGRINSDAVSRARSDDQELDKVLAARELYLQDHNHTRLTEIQMIRETLFMLQGLPAQIYSKTSGKVMPQASVAIHNITPEQLDKLLKAFCRIGTSLAHVRDRLEAEQTDPLLQTFQTSFLDLLVQFDLNLSIFEQELIASSRPANTLLSFRSVVDSAFKPLGILEPLLEAIPNQRSFHILDALYDLVIQQQSLGDFSLYKISADIFFNCLNTFLRPVKAWIDHGSLDEQSKDFFIKQKETKVSDSNLWRDQFYLDHDAEGIMRIPRFFLSIAQKAFIVGKGINLLSQLAPTNASLHQDVDLPLNFSTVCSNNVANLLPFEDNLADALENWLSDKCYISDGQVLQVFKEETKLQETLSAIQYLYCFRNGAISQQIAYSIFDRIDSSKRWLDKFLLTDLFQESLSSVPSLDVRRISVRIAARTTRASSLKSVQELTMINLDYHLPWCTAIVVQKHHIQIFQKVSTLLLQLKRASQLLNRNVTLDPYPQAVIKLILSLRQRLRWFVNTLFSYVTVAVIEGTIMKLRDHMQKSKDLDQLINAFDNTISALLESCVLAEPQRTTHNAIISLLDLPILFFDICSSRSIQTPPYSADNIPVESEDLDEEDVQVDTRPARGSKGREDALKKYSITFDQLLSFIIAGIQETTRTSQQTLLQSLVDNLKCAINEG